MTTDAPTALLLLALGAALALGLALGSHIDRPPDCHEDEVIAWAREPDVNAHTLCVHVDDLHTIRR